MASKALVVLAGNVGTSEMKFTASGTAILNFSLAVSTGYGERKITTWWNCTYWGKSAEKVSGYVTKGKNILVDGEPYLEKWESNDRKGASLRVNVKNLTFLGSKSDGQKTNKEQVNAYTSEDIPF